jgi:acetyl-CoA acetyltransferase
LFHELGIKPKVAETVNVGGATYSVMLQRAAALIEAGYVESVLCLGAGKFPKVGDRGGEQMARMVSHPQFEFIYGAYIPALYAQAASAHMARYGTTEAQLARVAVSARKWALNNPQALMREHGAITVDDVMSSRPICSPFKLLDCSVPCEGGAAILVTSRAMARDITDQPASLLGYGERHGFGHVSQAEDLTTLGAKDSGRQAYEMAGVTAADIGHAQLYDAFSINPIILLEDLGFCPAGEGGSFLEAGYCDPGGKLPVNTYGGLLSFGHTGDASGMSMIVEGAVQMMGLAGERQLPGELTLVHSYGGMMCEHATLILGRE